MAKRKRLKTKAPTQYTPPTAAPVVTPHLTITDSSIPPSPPDYRAHAPDGTTGRAIIDGPTVTVAWPTGSRTYQNPLIHWRPKDAPTPATSKASA